MKGNQNFYERELLSYILESRWDSQMFLYEHTNLLKMTVEKWPRDFFFFLSPPRCTWKNKEKGT